MAAPKQYEVWTTDGEPLVLVLQNDLLSDVETRVVIPLFPVEVMGRGLQSLNPTITVAGRELVVMTQLFATLYPEELVEFFGTAEHDRDQIVSAIEALLSGV